MLAAMQHFNRKCRRSRTCAFNDYVIGTIEQEPLVNPVQEQRFLAIAMKAVLQQAAERIWHHKDFYEALTEEITLANVDLPPDIGAAVNKTIQEAQSDTNLVKVTHMLIRNLEKEREG